MLELQDSVFSEQSDQMRYKNNQRKLLHSLGWGSLKNRDNKICSWVPWDSDGRKASLAMPGKNWKLQTRLLVWGDTPNHTNPQLSKNNKSEKGENWSRVPDECLTPRQTGRLTVGRNKILNFALTLLGTLCGGGLEFLQRSSASRKREKGTQCVGL
jgi:hypothetical protein